MKITAHTIVKNEDVWVWFAINSVLEFVDEVLVTVNGSSDNTERIIRSINSSKIKLTVVSEVDKAGVVVLRRDQLKATETDWLLILDGDEIWPKKEFEKLLKIAATSSDKIIAFFNRTRNCLGDVFHYLPESEGNYRFGEISGTLNMRLIRKTNDLKIIGEYPLESYINKDGPLAKQLDKISFADCWYLHTSYLKRSTQDLTKRSGSLGRSKFWQIGTRLNSEDMPEVLFLPRPNLVQNPLQKRSLFYEIAALISDPLIKLNKLFK